MSIKNTVREKRIFRFENKIDARNCTGPSLKSICAPCMLASKRSLLHIKGPERYGPGGGTG